MPCHFESQKEYVTDILLNEVDKRLDGSEERSFAKIDELPEDWNSYEVQDIVNADGAPSEQAIQLSIISIGRDIAIASKKLVDKQSQLLEMALEEQSQAPNTVTVEDYEDMKDVEMLEF